MTTTLLTPVPVAAAVVTASTAPGIGKTTYYNASSGNLTPSLPALSGLNVGARFAVRRDPTDLSSNIVTFTCAGSDAFYLSGATTITLPVTGEQREYEVIQPGGSGTKYWAPAGSLNPLSALDSRYIPGFYLVKNYGAKADAIATTAGITSGASALTKVSGSFTATDVGKTVVVKGAGTTRSLTGTSTLAIATGTTALTTTGNANFTAADVRSTIVIPGAGVAGAALIATIVNVISASSVTLDTAAGTTVSAATPTTTMVTAFLITTIASVASGVATLAASAGRTVTASSTLYGTNDAPAINAAITAAAAAGGGKVVLPQGNYLITSPINPIDHVRLVGNCFGQSVVYKANTTGPAIYSVRTAGNPLVGFGLMDLTLEGIYTQQPTSYAVSNKGIQTEYVSGCTYQNVIVQNMMATGFAMDYMTGGTVVHGCRAISNGAGTRAGSQGGGGSGFGIGTGNGVSVMDATISDCFSWGNGNYGIFFESENGTMSTGVKVINCTAANNFASGFSDCGLDGAIFSGCLSYGNAIDGFTNDSGTVISSGSKPGQNTLWTNCISRGNARHGFGYQPWALGIVGAPAYAPNTVQGVSWKNCKAIGNTIRGFEIQCNTPDSLDGLSLDNCEAYQNGSSGLLFWGSGTVKNASVNGGAYYGNGLISGSDTYGIRLLCNTNKMRIRGTNCYEPSASGLQFYGLALSSGFTHTDLVVEGNSISGRTGSVLFGATFAGTPVFRNNNGYNPVGSGVPGTAFALAATTVDWTNLTGVDVVLYCTAAGTVTSVVIKSPSTAVTVGTTMVAGNSYRIPAGGRLNVTYTVAPTLVAVGE